LENNIEKEWKTKLIVNRYMKLLKIKYIIFYIIRNILKINYDNFLLIKFIKKVLSCMQKIIS